MMASVEAVQLLDGTAPHFLGSNVCFRKLGSEYSIRSLERFGKRSVFKCMKSFKCLSSSYGGIWVHHQFPGANGVAHRYVANNKSRFMRCKCQSADNVGGLTSEGGNGTWLTDIAKDFGVTNGNVRNALAFETVEELKHESECSNYNGNSPPNETTQAVFAKVKPSSIEDEAWELLRESIVYYCDSPVGTIAAKDPNCSSVLNYDQVFIRDFIPSGIAFLLKGEYDIVRNFILYTLQLQLFV